MLFFTTNSRAICMSNSERRHCKTLLYYRWTHRTSPRGWTSPSRKSPIIVQRRLAYENDSVHYVTKGANLNSLLEHRLTSGWAVETMQESFAFPILAIGRLREDQLIHLETRVNMFFYTMGLWEGEHPLFSRSPREKHHCVAWPTRERKETFLERLYTHTCTLIHPHTLLHIILTPAHTPAYYS